MPIRRPGYVLAGFHADAPSPSIPALTHIGEEWLPARSHIAPHSHDVWEFYFQIDGVTRWELHGREFALGPGALLGVAPGVVHRLASPPAEAHHFFFAGIDIGRVLANCRDAPAAWNDPPPGFARHAPEIAPAFRQLVREVSLRSHYRTEGLRFALGFLAIELTRCLRAKPAPKSLVLCHPAVVRARELLDHQPGRAWTITSLATMSGLSPSRLNACFKTETGVTPHRYLMRARIEAARTLLRDTERSVTDIAHELGFASSQHLATTFKAITGTSPRTVRLDPTPRGRIPR